MNTKRIMENILIGVGAFMVITLMMNILHFSINVVDNTAKTTNNKIIDLEKKVSDLENKLAEKPIQKVPDYSVPIVLGSFILGGSALGITLFVIDYKKSKSKK